MLIALGMTLGFVGDLLLADALPVKQGFLAGMGAFALGHIAYIVAILSQTPHFQWTVEGLALLVGLVGWYRSFFAAAKARCYCAGRRSLCATACHHGGRGRGAGDPDACVFPLALGAALFLVSDLLVAGEQFGRLRFPHIGDAVWLTYGPAQMLIVYAVNSALVAAPLR